MSCTDGPECHTLLICGSDLVAVTCACMRTLDVFDVPCSSFLQTYKHNMKGKLQLDSLCILHPTT